MKLYVEEPESAELEGALLGRRDVLVSELAVTEVTSALARRVRAGDLSARDAGRIQRRILSDVARGELQRIELSPDSHRAAERLLLHIGSVIPLRAADALHLALASGIPTRAFVTFDQQLRAAALRMGIFDVNE
ncbi:MAG: type II toxin-antitoxin system VapC family toxin [Deltaproteobacteria bacterium]|nr:type II toxin-antitoxin system VapC family toxin [Deltaproteobacteria bacterium]